MTQIVSCFQDPVYPNTKQEKVLDVLGVKPEEVDGIISPDEERIQKLFADLTGLVIERFEKRLKIINLFFYAKSDLTSQAVLPHHGPGQVAGGNTGQTTVKAA